MFLWRLHVSGDQPRYVSVPIFGSRQLPSRYVLGTRLHLPRHMFWVLPASRHPYVLGSRPRLLPLFWGLPHRVSRASLLGSPARMSPRLPFSALPPRFRGFPSWHLRPRLSNFPLRSLRVLIYSRLLPVIIPPRSARRKYSPIPPVTTSALPALMRSMFFPLPP